MLVEASIAQTAASSERKFDVVANILRGLVMCIAQRMCHAFTFTVVWI